MTTRKTTKSDCTSKTTKSSAPFSRRYRRRVHRKVVITGGPSVGKSTLAKLLRSVGFTVSMEQAVKVLKEKRVPHPTVNRDAFQLEVLRRQLNAERRKKRISGIGFLDRGAFDGIAYYLCDGLPVPTVFDGIDPKRYSLVLLLDDLSRFVYDGNRFEDYQFTKRITPLLSQVYSERGIPVIPVPALPPVERLNFVLAILGYEPVVPDQRLKRLLRRLGFKE